MSDLKKLFKRNEQVKYLVGSTYNRIEDDVESKDLVESTIKNKERFTPLIDYSKPENFAKFGLAEQYYEDSIGRIIDFYPYDGSDKEKINFHLTSTDLDNYIFENEYPRRNGYITLSTIGAGAHSGPSSEGFFLRNEVLEYINFKGGPHSSLKLKDSNKFDISKNRESNLLMDGDRGNTVEFWLKKDEFLSLPTSGGKGAEPGAKEVLFDLHNGEDEISDSYGRFCISFQPGFDLETSNLEVLYLSGSLDSNPYGFYGGFVIDYNIADGKWRHYSVSLKNTDTNVKAELYINGDLYKVADNYMSNEYGNEGPISKVTGIMNANIGALVDQYPFDDQTFLGQGRISGSIDEFRYWKSRRSSKEIGRNWFTQVGGGTNNDESNTDLGVYFKFNEGIYGTDAVDSRVIDYSGRSSHGTWMYYEPNSASVSSPPRVEGSAMVESGYANTEFKDPIIYRWHTDVDNLIKEKKLIGSAYDISNNSTMYNMLPAWILEEDEAKEGYNLRKLTQIMSSYFDTLHSQIGALSSLKNIQYNGGSGSIKPIPFAENLLESTGLIVPDIFVDSNVLEQFSHRDEDRDYEDKIYNIKNIIYQNLYNNIVNIYKSKGTEKSFRNIIRCFGIDEELVKIGMYANNTEYKIRDNRRYSATRKNFIDFNNVDRYSSTVYQKNNLSNTNTKSYLASSELSNELSGSAFTYESEIIFPNKFTKNSELYFETPFLISSLFGIHNVASSDTDPAFVLDMPFKVQVARDLKESSHVTFQLRGAINLDSPKIYDVYNDTHWNVSIRIKPSKHPLKSKINSDNASYEVFLSGYNNISDEIVKSFNVSGTLSYSNASQFLVNPKRIYIGAERTNFTGTIVNNTDVKISGVRVWYDFLEDDELKSHAIDSSNHGRKNPLRDSFLFDESIDLDIKQIETLALHWDFSTITGSTSTGGFIVPDISSGSVSETPQHGWLGNTLKYQHSGEGFNFPVSSIGIISKEYVQSGKLVGFENLQSIDSVSILREDDEYFNKDTRPISYYYSFEKSMYHVISEEMISWFSTIIDFNNLIGEPVNNYRHEYKDINKLRQLFFNKVGNNPDIDKFTEFYKWIDSSLSIILEQMIPATAEFSDGIKNVVESHILERNKYQHVYPSLKISKEVGVGKIEAINRLKYSWKRNHAPIGLNEEDNCSWWRGRSERDSSVLSTGDINVDNNRKNILSSSYIDLVRSFSTPYSIDVDQFNDIKIGSNIRKNTSFIDSIIHFNSSDNLTINASSLHERNICDDIITPNKKKKWSFKVNVGSGQGYTSGKGDILAPFDLISSSVNSGYAADISSNFKSNVGVTNYHTRFNNGLQGPFTDKHVGGMQYDRTNLNRKTLVKSLDTSLTRAEGFDIKINSSAIVIDGVEIDSYNRPRAFYNKGTRSPLNIKNIKQSTGSLGDYTELGNFSRRYEFFSTTGRKNNNKSLLKNFENNPIDDYNIHYDGIRTVSTQRYTEDPSVTLPHPYVQDREGYTVPNRQRYEGIISSKFSAPGTPESMSPYGLDTESGEMSPYNALPWRNHSVRISTGVLGSGSLRGELTKHSGQFGIHGVLGEINSENYNVTDASWHKINRNRLSVLKELSDGSIVSGNQYDNYWINHEIPRNDHQYSWISSSMLRIDVYGTGSSTLRTGHLNSVRTIPYNSTSIYEPTLTFMSASAHGASPRSNSTALFMKTGYGLTVNNPIHQSYADRYKIIPVDFIGLNTIIMKPTASVNSSGISENIVGITFDDLTQIGFSPTEKGVINPYIMNSNTEYEYFESVGRYRTLSANRHAIPGLASTYGLNEPDILKINSILHNRGGIYGWPSWKQIRGSEHLLTRIMRNGVPGSPERRRTHDSNIIQYVDITRDRNISGVGTFDMQPSALKSGIIRSFIEPVLTNKYYPITHIFTLKDSSINRSDSVRLTHDYGNNIVTFTNEEINNKLNTIITDRQKYDEIKELYLNADNSDDPIKFFKSLVYKETVFPREKYAFLDKTRSRQDFGVGYWRSGGRSKRNKRGIKNSYGYILNEKKSVGSPKSITNFTFSSMWCMDATSSFSDGNLTRPNQNSLTYVVNASGNTGELQTVATQWHGIGHSNITSSYIDRIIPGPIYARYGEEAANWSLSSLWPASLYTYDLYLGGMTKWEVPEQSGKEPFYYKNYDSYVEDIKRKAKDYTIIPEFRISENMEFYINEAGGNFFAVYDDLISLTGSTLNSSKDDNFYEEYSHSDFMKYFGVISDDHKDYVDITSLTLTCKAKKKFLPYDGFYPVLRTLELSNLFSSSYADNITADIINRNSLQYGKSEKRSFQTLSSTLFGPGILYNTIKSGIAVDWPIMTGTFEITGSAQGSFYPVSGAIPNNTSWSGPTTRDNQMPRINDRFHSRIPFEALLEPENHLKNIGIVKHDVSPNKSYDAVATWDGNGSPLYKLAMHNFLAETVNFFLKDEKLSSFVSLPDNDPDFGLAEVREIDGIKRPVSYIMDIELTRPYKSSRLDTSIDNDVNKTITSLSPLQTKWSVVSGSFEMYNRAGAFGVPVSYTMSDGLNNLNLIDKKSCNYSHVTPPYYDGLSRIRLIFRAHDGSRKYNLNEILNNLTATFSRRVDAKSNVPWLAWGTDEFYNLTHEPLESDVRKYNRLYGIPVAFTSSDQVSYLEDRMYLDSSIDYLSSIQRSIRSTKGGSSLDSLTDPEAVIGSWVISTKFESPVLNFSHRINNIEIPSRGSGSISSYHTQGGLGVNFESYGQNAILTSSAVSWDGKFDYYPSEGGYGGGPSVGMWHQYGEKSSSPRDSILLTLKDFPDSHRGMFGENISEFISSPLKKFGKEGLSMTGSLADLVGFDKSSRQIGSIASQKKISEAVVAIPFKLNKENGQKEYFEISKEQIRLAKELANGQVSQDRLNALGITEGDLPGKSIINMVRSMDKFVFPPTVDFLKNPKINPMVMYIFEFSHILDEDDLSDIWQSLPPKLAYNFEEEEVKISHDFKVNEFFGRAVSPKRINDSEDISDSDFIDEMRWMVFKVKQRAEKNYYNVTLKSKDDNNFKFNIGNREDIIPEYSYNWPYDYFSMVELIKLDTKVVWGDQREFTLLPKLEDSRQDLPTILYPPNSLNGLSDRITNGQGNSDGQISTTGEIFRNRDKDRDRSIVGIPKSISDINIFGKK